MGGPSAQQAKSGGKTKNIVIAVLTLIVALGIGGTLWFTLNPEMYVDNPSQDEINVYVDGEKIGEVAADEHKHFDVPRGEHAIGWSKSDEDEAKHTFDVELELGTAYLYSPGKLACYRLVVDTYGIAASLGKDAGPQPIKEFYAFDHINAWFEDNPETVNIPKKSEGTTRTAVKRSKLCAEFSHCPLDLRAKLVECEIDAFKGTEDGPEFKKAFVECAQPVVAKCPPEN
jgi:hypothetical protein